MTLGHEGPVQVHLPQNQGEKSRRLHTIGERHKTKLHGR